MTLAVPVILADDHPIILQGLKNLLLSQKKLSVVACCEEGHAALHAIKKHPGCLAVIDVRMPLMSGLELLAEATETRRDTRIILFSANLPIVQAVAALRQGAWGFLYKDQATVELLSCLDTVRLGEQWIPADIKQALMQYPLAASEDFGVSPREREIIELVTRGLTNKEIAKQIGITEGTVKTHVHNIFQKLSVANRAELVAYAMRNIFHVSR